MQEGNLTRKQHPCFVSSTSDLGKALDTSHFSLNKKCTPPTPTQHQQAFLAPCNLNSLCLLLLSKNGGWKIIANEHGGGALTPMIATKNGDCRHSFSLKMSGEHSYPLRITGSEQALPLDPIDEKWELRMFADNKSPIIVATENERVVLWALILSIAENESWCAPIPHPSHWELTWACIATENGR